MVQRYVGIAAGEAGKYRRKKSRESFEGIPAEGAEQQIEPDYVGLLLANRSQNVPSTCQVIERPTTFHPKSFKLRLGSINLICQDRQANKRIALQFVRNM
jgi:hypothetical protein